MLVRAEEFQDIVLNISVCCSQYLEHLDTQVFTFFCGVCAVAEHPPDN